MDAVSFTCICCFQYAVFFDYAGFFQIPDIYEIIPWMNLTIGQPIENLITSSIINISSIES